MKLHAIAALLCVTVSCSNPEPVSPAGPSNNQTGSTCSVQGNGNTINCVAATPTPTPASAPACSKLAPVYQEIVVQAEVGIPAAQSQAAYIAAVSAAVKAAGFLVMSGPPLPPDEIALKTSATALFSETYDVWRADNTPQVLYQETCKPPIF